VILKLVDATVITGTITGYLADALPTWAAAAGLIYMLTRIYEWARVAIWKKPPR
jgi:hypothetical protein